MAPLPIESRSLGTESAELRALAHETGAATYARAPARALFASTPTGPEAKLPNGVHRVEFGAGDERGVALYSADVARSEQDHEAVRLAMKRSGRYRAGVERVLRAWHVPEELTAIPFVESGFIPTAVTVDRGVGLWSLPSDVANAYGLVMTASYDERRSVALATEVAAHYLADLHERLGSWEFAACGFGQGYVRTLAALSSQDPSGAAPAECVAYVRAVTALATTLANPERFGFEVQPDSPTTASDLEVPAGTSFRLVARAAGSTVERLHELNPEYLAEVVPDAGIPMVVHVPAEGLARAKESLMSLLYATSAEGRPAPAARVGRDDGRTGDETFAGKGRSFYRVRDGETLDGLAARFGVSRSAIAGDNALDPAASLRGGQLLLINAPQTSSGAGDPHAHH